MHLLLKAWYREIFRSEGIRGLFKGSIQRCLIVAPLFAVSLLVYEAQQHYLLPLASPPNQIVK